MEIGNMQTKTATIEFIKQDNNTEVQVTQNGLIASTWYPSELADKIQKVISGITLYDIFVIQKDVNKLEVYYDTIFNQKLLKLKTTSVVIQGITYNISIYVDSFQDNSKLKIEVDTYINKQDKDNFFSLPLCYKTIE